MKAFNSKKHHRKKINNKSYTHLRIIYENLEVFAVPLKEVEIQKSICGKYIEQLEINFAALKKNLSLWYYSSIEDRIKRLINNSNDICCLHLIRYNKNTKSYLDCSEQEIKIKDYFDPTGYGWGVENLLQSTVYLPEEDKLIYQWNNDEEIKIEWNEEKNKLTINKKYKKIISKLNKENWEIKITD